MTVSINIYCICLNEIIKNHIPSPKISRVNLYGDLSGKFFAIKSWLIVKRSDE